MQGDERLLLDPLDRHTRHLPRPHRLEQRFGIGTVGLVAADIRPHIGGRHEGDPVAMPLRHPAPVVGRAAGFHDDVRRRRCRQEPRKLPAVEPMASREAPLAIGHGQFEDGLCEVDGYCHSMHVGLLLILLMSVS